MNVRTQIVSPVKDSLTDWRWWFSIAQIVFGCVLVAAGFALFINPYNIVPGGVYGMGLVLHNLFPDIQVGTFGYMYRRAQQRHYGRHRYRRHAAEPLP